MEIKEIALAIAKANRHPDPEGFAAAAERAADGQPTYPEEVALEEARLEAQAEEDARVAAQAAMQSE